MGKYLLDTHTLLWVQEDSPHLSAKAKETIRKKTNEIYVSIASFWEIVIKISLGKLILNYTLNELHNACVFNNIIVLPIQLSNLNHLENLPFHHKDPFDRLISATAIDLQLQVITKDGNIGKYPLNILW